MNNTFAKDVPADALDFSEITNTDTFKYDRWQALFKKLRDEAPVYKSSDPMFGEFWSVTRHKDIQFVDTNAKLFSSEPTISLGDDIREDFSPEAFITMDGERHRQQRNAVKGIVSPASLADLEGALRGFVADILDNLPVGEEFNWVEKVSIDLTSRMLATLFAVPQEMRHQLIYWSTIATSGEEIFGGNQTGLDREQRIAELMECLGVFQAIWQERAERVARGEPYGFDLISMLMQNEDTKDMISDPMTLMGNVMLLIVGGNDTTRNSISGSVLALHNNPGEFQKVKSDFGLIPNMCQEAIRWQTPVIYMRRTATQDVELGGKLIREGDKVVMWYISGNRDERVIQDPDRFWVDRPDAHRHISFGFGVHRCMGKRLAELQLKILWEEILKRFDRVEVTGEVERVESLFVRGISNLPVVLHPKAS